jgi:25S rRNA (uracil2634-N3)-methyltransferase
VVWNFPCVARAADGTATEAALNGFDARSAEELEANRALVESFVSGASSYLVPEKGEIHITHKVGMQCDWSISKAASSCRSSELTCAGAVVFDRMSYPAYKPRKALVAKSFPVTDARTFVFTNSPDGTAETLDPSSKLVSRVAKS